jgi:hypothetical protein
VKKVYNDILFNEYGQPIALSTDDIIEYLLENLHQLRHERDLLENQLVAIQLILNPKDQLADF